MELVYTPKVCKKSVDDDGKEHPPTFEGTVKVKLPSFDERFQYLDESQFNVDDDGDVKTSKMDQLKSVRKLVSLSVPHYVEVNLKHKESGKEYKTFDDLTYDSKCDRILTDIAVQMVSGFKAGND